MKVTVKYLSLDEKLKLLAGKNHWCTHDLGGKLTSVFMADGPNGLRMQDKDGKTIRVTAMPNISVIANSWDKDLAYLDGATIADDCIEHDVDILLAPGVNIKRTPLNGRNFEYFSEDPLLAGNLAKAYIDGVQDKGVGTSLKHYCANNREYDRLYQCNEIDERALFEIYLKPFEIAVKAKPWTVMCSYNLVNGVWMSEHRKLLNDVLREKFGFDGLIVSDWSAVHNHVNAVKATLDLRMPYHPDSFNELKAGYEKGELTDEEIDFCVNNLIKLADRKDKVAKKAVQFSKKERHENAVKIAKESIVLLKNEDNVLPLKGPKTITVAGKYADNPTMGGGGSAMALTDFVQPELSKMLSEKLKTEVKKGTALRGGFASEANASGDYVRGIRYDYQNILESDVAVICVGEQAPTVSENYDRHSMKLSIEQEDFILHASELNDNVVVVVYGGSAIDMSAWIDCVKAVVFVGFAGEGVNEALSSILVGETNPSGKLAETFPLALEDTFTESDFGDKNVEWYNDGIFVGYRYYDKADIDVLYPFGHGLSYSEFEYSDLSVEKVNETEYKVSYNVKNVSDVDGKEISQVYVKEMLPYVIRPEKELKGYSKDLIRAGETKRITVKLGIDAFAYYSTARDCWHVDNGTFEIMVGASSRDIRLSERIKVEK